MSFLSPAFLLALPLVAVPVIIHFFARRNREVIRWGAMEFLLGSSTPRRRFLRLKDLLLMLLRVALVLAMVAALAQPMISSNVMGTTGPRDVILVLDNSLSTARKLGSSTIFERELDETDKLLKQLNPTDVIRVLLAAPAPEWLSDAPISADGSAKSALAARLRELTPTEGAADMFGCVQEALKAESAGKDMPRFVTVVTDGQAHGWRADAPGAWSAIQTLAKKASPPAFMRVIVADAGNTPVANLAIEKMSTARTVVGAGQPVILTASVKNTGTAPTGPTALSWNAGEQSLGLTSVPALQPGAGATINFSQPFPTPGLVDVSCRLEAQDDLPADNACHFLIEVTKAAPILVVEGEPEADPIQSDSRYFLAALGYGDGPDAPATSPSIFQPKLIDAQHLAGQDLTGFQCVVLANVRRFPADVIQKLVRHVNSGGGLWIALGGETDVDAFNQTFSEQGAGLSPLSLKQPVGDPENREKFVSVSPPSSGHPATALLADTQRLDMDRLRIYRRHQFDADAANTVSVLLRAEGGAPLVIEKTLGRGRVIVQAIPLGLAWSNLPLCHSYVVMVHEWLWYLAEPGLMKRNLQAGEVLQASQPIGASNGSAALETPTGKRVQLVGEEEQGRLVFRYAKTLFPGEYKITMADAKEGTHMEKFLVSRDPEESNLTPLSQQQIGALADAGGLTFAGDQLYQAPAQKVPAPPRALAQWLLLALLLFLAVETIMAFWLARQRRSAPAAIVWEPKFRV